MSTYDQLQTIIAGLEDALVDAEKFDKGVAAAGTRLRKAAQEAKKALQELRVNVSETRKARKEASA